VQRLDAERLEEAGAPVDLDVEVVRGILADLALAVAAGGEPCRQRAALGAPRACFGLLRVLLLRVLLLRARRSEPSRGSASTAADCAGALPSSAALMSNSDGSG